MKCRQRRRIKPLDILLAAICAVSLTAAALIGWTIFHQDAVYRELSIDAEADADDGIDWDGLRARNPDIAAWVSVEGTPVDFPVVSPREGDPKGFYLNHDFDRNWSFSGCPYLDPRCGADGRHALVYGHHLNFDGEMFTYLRDAWRQEKFDALGDMRWSTPAEGTVSLHPAFSMSVDQELRRHTEVRLQRDRGAARLALGPLGAGHGEGGRLRRALRRSQARRHPRDLLGQLRGRPSEDPHGIRRLIFPTNMSYYGKEAQKRE